MFPEPGARHSGNPQSAIRNPQRGPGRSPRWGAVAYLAAWALLSAPAWADDYVGFYATQVVDFSPGAGYEGMPDPVYALGAPRGAGESGSSVHVVTLGLQGSLTLGFTDANGSAGWIADAPGDDFIVSENAMVSWYTGGTFIELLRVQVSSDGVHFAEFPTRCDQTTPIPPDFLYNTVDPSLYSGFAGTRPVLYDADSGGPAGQRDPYDPDDAGGDPFDLADLAAVEDVVLGLVDVNHIQYVRLIDVNGDGSELDSNGQPIYDPSGLVDRWPDDEDAYRPLSADVDAVTVIHGLREPERLCGDADEDGDVDSWDYLVVKGNLGTLTGADWPDGDFTGDGRVDGEDLALLDENFGADASGGEQTAGEPVPEPLGLVALALAAAMLRHRRRRHAV